MVKKVRDSKTSKNSYNRSTIINDVEFDVVDSYPHANSSSAYISTNSSSVHDTNGRTRLIDVNMDSTNRAYPQGHNINNTVTTSIDTTNAANYHNHVGIYPNAVLDNKNVVVTSPYKIYSGTKELQAPPYDYYVDKHNKDNVHKYSAGDWQTQKRKHDQTKKDKTLSIAVLFIIVAVVLVATIVFMTSVSNNIDPKDSITTVVGTPNVDTTLRIYNAIEMIYSRVIVRK